MTTIRENCTVIAFTGTFGSGKDFLANIARKNLFAGKIVQNVSFADLLKMNSMLMRDDENGCLEQENDGLDTLEERYTEFFSTKPEGVRRIIQTYGENHRLRNPNIWIHGLYTQMLNQYYVNDATVFLISDLRFPMEAEFVKRLGGTIVKVVAPERSGRFKERYSDKSVKNHISETFVDNIVEDYMIENDTTEYDELILQLHKIIYPVQNKALNQLHYAYNIHKMCG